jgi:uncharacterized RDD family membrane protein YckC
MNRQGAIDTVTDIDTPERVRLSCRLAGPAQRAAAYVLDLLLRIAIVMAVGVAAMGAGVGGEDLSGVGTGLLLVAIFLTEWGYYVFCELLMNGQSIGKRAFGLRVVKTDGLPIGLGESVLRNLLRAADFLPTFHVVGALAMSLDPRFRRLGDMVAGTLVISEQTELVQSAIVLRPAPTADELRALPSRISLSADELDAVEQFIRRSPALSPSRAEELAELVAPLFAERLGVRYHDPVRFLSLLHHRATHPGALA